MRFACRNCGKAYNLADAKIAGKQNVKLKCRVCGSLVEIKRQGAIVAQLLPADGLRERLSEAPPPYAASQPPEVAGDAKAGAPLKPVIGPVLSKLEPVLAVEPTPKAERSLPQQPDMPAGSEPAKEMRAEPDEALARPAATPARLESVEATVTPPREPARLEPVEAPVPPPEASEREALPAPAVVRQDKSQEPESASQAKSVARPSAPQEFEFSESATSASVALPPVERPLLLQAWAYVVAAFVTGVCVTLVIVGLFLPQ